MSETLTNCPTRGCISPLKTHQKGSALTTIRSEKQGEQVPPSGVPLINCVLMECHVSVCFGRLLTEENIQPAGWGQNQ